MNWELCFNHARLAGTDSPYLAQVRLAGTDSPYLGQVRLAGNRSPHYH